MKMKSKNIRRKSVAVLAGIAIVGAVGASAASLGGIGNDTLGADADVVASCDTDGVAVEYTTDYEPTLVFGGATGGYVVTSAEVTGVNEDCDGLEYSIVLTGAAGTVLDSGSGTVALTGGAFGADLLDGDSAAEAVTGVALVISGPITVTP